MYESHRVVFALLGGYFHMKDNRYNYKSGFIITIITILLVEIICQSVNTKQHFASKPLPGASPGWRMGEACMELLGHTGCSEYTE